VGALPTGAALIRILVNGENMIKFNTEIILKSERFVIKDIKRKTQAQFFKDLTDGDVIEISLALQRQHYAVAVVVDITNVKTGVMGTHTLNTIRNYLACFELEPVKL
jgi:hypothetical protein